MVGGWVWSCWTPTPLSEHSLACSRKGGVWYVFLLSIITCILRIRRLELKLMRSKRLVWPVFGELKVQILDVLKFENELAHLTRIDLRLRKMVLVVIVANSNRVTQPIWPKIYRFSGFLIWPHFFLGQNFWNLFWWYQENFACTFWQKNNISDPTSNDTHTTPIYTAA